MDAPEEYVKDKVVIVGAGIIGLATAYELSKEFSVHVVEKRGTVCEGASYQNGGVINVESITPVNSYMNLWTTLKSSVMSYITGTPTNTMVRSAALLEPNLLLWVKHFIWNSSTERILHHSEGMRQIGAAITPLMEELFQETKFDGLEHNYHYTPGLLLSKVEDPEKFVFKKKKMFDEIFVKRFVTNAELAKVKDTSGILGLDEAGHNVGCVEPHNITVNTKKLGDSLKEHLMKKGVKFSCGKEVKLVSDGDIIKHVVCNDGQLITGDRYVVCSGYDSNRMLRSLGLNIPLVPIKAYSLHISNVAAAANWTYAVHIQAEVAGLFTPYKEGEGINSIRVTGIRDMDGSEPIERAERVKALKKVARKFAGSDWTDQDVNVWCGIMPLSPDDFPVIGPTRKFSNLFLNVGHGFRGTAYALPSARLLYQLMCGITETGKTCFDKKFADPARFGL